MDSVSGKPPQYTSTGLWNPSYLLEKNEAVEDPTAGELATDSGHRLAAALFLPTYEGMNLAVSVAGGVVVCPVGGIVAKGLDAIGLRNALGDDAFDCAARLLTAIPDNGARLVGTLVQVPLSSYQLSRAAKAALK